MAQSNENTQPQDMLTVATNDGYFVVPATPETLGTLSDILRQVAADIGGANDVDRVA